MFICSVHDTATLENIRTLISSSIFFVCYSVCFYLFCSENEWKANAEPFEFIGSHMDSMVSHSIGSVLPHLKTALFFNSDPHKTTFAPLKMCGVCDACVVCY